MVPENRGDHFQIEMAILRVYPNFRHTQHSLNKIYVMVGQDWHSSLLVSDLVAKSRNQKRQSPSQVVLRHVLSMCWVHLAKHLGKHYIQLYSTRYRGIPPMLFRTSLQKLNLLPKKCSKQLVAQK